jgi:hypothetical protein
LSLWPRGWMSLRLRWKLPRASRSAMLRWDCIVKKRQLVSQSIYFIY